MIRLALALLAGLLAAGCAAQDRSATGDTDASAGPQPWLTLDDLYARPSVTGTSPVAPTWSPDSARLAFLWDDACRPRRELWLVEADGTDLRRLTDPGDETGGVDALAWLPDGEGLVFLRGGHAWRTDLGGRAKPLTDEAGARSDLDVSPDGRHASFRQDGDLWLLELETGALTRATHVGVPTISSVTLGRYARAEVEIGPYVWGGPTYAWSPDSRTIAVHHVDRRGMRSVPFPDHLGQETDPNPVRRSYPGDPNSERRVGLLSVESGELSLLDLPDPTATRVVDFSWSDDGRLLVDQESDTAVDRWLHVVDPATGDVGELWHDRRETRVYTACGSAWSPDGEGVVFLGDLADRYGLYALHAGDDEPTRLGDPAFDVTSPPLVARHGRAVFFQSNKPSPSERHVFRVDAEGGATRLTQLPGEHRATPSPDGRRVALLHSSDTSPTELYLVDASGAERERRITRSPPADFETRPWGTVRYASFPDLAGERTLHARIIEPADLDRSERHPVLFGPVYSNTVRNRWGGRWAMLQQLLVSRGYLVVQVDVRGSTGYGRDFREEFLGDFAGRDLDDLEAAVAHVESLPYVDPDRLGVWGSSYGGTLTLYALLKKPGLFQAGVAGAAAVDPHFFGGDDVAIVRRPDTHPEAFQRGAAQYAANLEGDLLIIHGMQDQVVPFKTTVALAEELMRQGKDFDFAFAPAGTHGWTRPEYAGRYLLGKLLEHFDRALGPAPARP